MIEINAKLLRDQSAVFMCGEVVECLIDFIHPSLPEHKISQSNSDILENLAWATVQLHCYCNASFNEKSSTNDAVSNRNVGGSTSLNASNQLKGEVLHSTEPKILFCDLRLSPGEAKQFLYRETVPLNTPPTYRGIRVKYYYKITVATQRLGSTVQALNIPIRVLPLPLPQSDLDEAITLNDESNEDLAPNNPFLEKKRPPSRIEYALHYLRGVTARRRPNFFMINNKWGKVGRFCLFKAAYKLGEDIVATIDFSCGTIKCVQLSVTLQCEETELNTTPITSTGVKNELAVSDAAAATDNSTEAANEPAERHKNISRVTNYSKHHEVCLGMLQTQVILPIPLHVTPTFRTELVEVSWRLHFQFVTSTNQELSSEMLLDRSNENEEELEWVAPTDIAIETMIWSLPITIYPTAPLQIPQPCGEYKLNIK
ncbi:RAB6A-GEF complex partner protein 2 [Anopheles maculipalpis]|uniref:RAB6A-GEF complex partner protein 2 n=1 Tax=Anopheles maculipalpis TaxID=1496333 RepID=UPI002158AA5D|nr:RAB6A-GEF complex partner protein 2 [Anopheles maculipalpis]